MSKRDVFVTTAKGILAVVLLASLAACGLKGKPVSVERVVPRAPTHLKVEATAEGLRLSCSVPQRNNDDTPLLDLDLIEFSRGGVAASDCPTCPPNFVKIAEVAYAYPAKGEMARGSVEILDPLKRPGLYQYRAVARNRAGLTSPPSNRAEAFWDVPPGAVEGLRITGGYKQLDISWDPVRRRADGSPAAPGEVGYQLFKTRKGGEFGAAPVHGKPLQEPHFLDTAVQNYVSYQYRVRAVRMVKDRSVAGPFSGVVEGVPEKLLPPDAPEGLVAFPTPTGVRLVWEGAEKRDVTGYRVYRSEAEAGPWSLLTTEPVQTVVFNDVAAVRDKSYWYAVTAVDDAKPPKESAKSKPVRVHVSVSPLPGVRGGKKGD